MSVESPVAFHVMTKPIGPLCNLDCHYCFYLHKEDLFPESRKPDWRMSDETLDTYVRQYIEAQQVPSIDFAWQGGEPTLLGLDFFRRAVELQQKYCPPGKTVSNAFQTNGVLIDDAWAAFFKEHDFLIGISLDGPRDTHDRYRVDKGGRPSFDKVMNGRGFLVKHGVRHNALCCVNRFNGDRPLDVYRFFRDEGFEWVQFIPIVERRDFETKSPGAEPPPQRTPADFVHDWSVLPLQYGKFLVQIFDEWVRHDVGTIHVQIIEECVTAWMGMEPSLCIFKPTCGRALAIEHNGDLFSCDHFVYDDFKLGNIKDKHIAELATSPFQQKFGTDKLDTLPRYCRECDVRFMCNGGCPKNRFIKTPDGESGLNYLCAGYKRFFGHVDPYMKTIVQLLRSRRPADGIMEIIRQSDQTAAGRAGADSRKGAKKNKRTTKTKKKKTRQKAAKPPF